MYVNQYLQTLELENCFFAGDNAHSQPDLEHASIMSCQQGRPQGRYAGYNAVSQLFNKPLILAEATPTPPPVILPVTTGADQE